MQVACVQGIADLARASTSAEAAAAYRGEQMTFGRDYLIPKPFDPRLSGIVSPPWRARRWSRAWPRARWTTSTSTRPIWMPASTSPRC